MPRYHVTVPVTVFCTYAVEAEDEDAALQTEANLSRLFYEDVTNGISLGHDAVRVSGLMNDNASWDEAEVALAEEE